MKLVLLLLVAGVAVARAGVIGTFGEKVHQGAVKIDEKITSFLGGNRPPGPPGPPGPIHRHPGPLTHGLAGHPQGPPPPQLHRPIAPVPFQPQAPAPLAPVAPPQYQQPQVPQRTTQQTTTVADDDDDLAAVIVNQDTPIEPAKPQGGPGGSKTTLSPDDRHIIDGAPRCDGGKVWIEEGCREIDN